MISDLKLAALARGFFLVLFVWSSVCAVLVTVVGAAADMVIPSLEKSIRLNVQLFSFVLGGWALVGVSCLSGGQSERLLSQVSTLGQGAALFSIAVLWPLCRKSQRE